MASKSQRVNDFSKFVKLSDLQCDGLYGMSDDFIIAHRPSANWVNIYKIDFDNKTVGGNYPGFAMYDFARMRMFMTGLLSYQDMDMYYVDSMRRIGWNINMLSCRQVYILLLFM